MIRTKNTTRKYPTGLPPAQYPSIATGMEERNHHYQQLQLIGAEAPTNDWTDLTPTFEEPVSPALAQAVDQLNQDYEELPPQTLEELSDLVEDLRNNPPNLAATEQVIETSPEQVEEPDLMVESSTSTSTVIAETVAETPRAPLLLSRRVTAVLAPTKSRPRPPTSAVKCPRPSLRGPTEEPKKKKEAHQPHCSAGNQEVPE